MNHIITFLIRGRVLSESVFVLGKTINRMEVILQKRFGDRFDHIRRGHVSVQGISLFTTCAAKLYEQLVQLVHQ